MKYGKKIKNINFYLMTLGIIAITILIQLGIQYIAR